MEEGSKYLTCLTICLHSCDPLGPAGLGEVQLAARRRWPCPAEGSWDLLCLPLPQPSPADLYYAATPGSWQSALLFSPL